MKPTLNTMLFAFLLVLSTLSCNNEDLFIESTTEVVIDDTATADAGIITDASLPCGFTLSNIEENATIIINCMMDLGGQTINLPSGVTIIYEGGDIINGILNFSGNSIIPGEILNSSLTLGGSTPQIKDTTFQFDPHRWGIVEGKVSNQVALKNKEILNVMFTQAKNMGITTFEIGAMDAYFDVRSYNNNTEYSIERGFSVPSDFTLNMSNNTHLRVQPNGAPAYVLLGIFKGENINIRGGNLYGDRWEHNYNPVNDNKNRPRDSHEWGHVIMVAGGKNVVIDNVKISDASGDGIGVVGSDIRNVDASIRNGETISENVTIRNSVIKSSRRNGMSLLDGNGVLVENCEIKDTGNLESPAGVNYSSAGTWPKYGISFEAFRLRTSTGELQEYNKIENVILRGNIFTNNSAGDVVLFTCSNITLEKNYFDSMIGNVAANNIIIRDNIMKAKTKADGSPWPYGILFHSRISVWDGEFNYNYTISGNTVEGYQNGVVVGGKNYKVFNNKIKNCRIGMVFEKLDDADFNNNEISSIVKNSIGYHSNGAVLKNVIVSDENIKVDYRSINLRNLVTENANIPLLFTNNLMMSVTKKDNFIDNSKNIRFNYNVINANFAITNSENIIITNNTSY